MEDMKIAEYMEEIEEFFNTGKKSNMKTFLLKKLDESFLDIENVYLKFNKKNLEIFLRVLIGYWIIFIC